MQEGFNVEFKREFTSDIRKAVIAFANSEGGVIYVGRDDDRHSYPLADVDQTLTQITNSIRTGILPDVTMFVRYETDENSINITVKEGNHKPYYLPENGIVPSGVYVRQGASSARASHELIREMIKQADGEKLDASRSLEQELTFKEAAEEFGRRNVEFGESQMRTLGIIGADGLYSNLGYWLSDQCPYTIKIAVFNGLDVGEFKTRREVEGSIFKQMHEALDFLSMANNLNAHISRFIRVEQYDYPEAAMREALINAIIHRDYNLSGSILVKVYDDRMDFISLGGLMPGLLLEDLYSGISLPRNERLANVFYRLKHIEAYGTGIRAIMNEYADMEVKPKITITHSVFVMSLPNINYARKQREAVIPTTQQSIVLDYLRSNPYVTNEIVQELLSVKQTRAYGIIREMVEDDMLTKYRTGRESKEYVLSRKK